MEFVAYNPRIREWGTRKVSLQGYRLFYSLVRGERSISQVDDRLKQTFEAGPVSRLLLYVPPSTHLKNKRVPHSVQEVQFLPDGSYFRIAISNTEPVSWAYFFQSDDTALQHLFNN